MLYKFFLILNKKNILLYLKIKLLHLSFGYILCKKYSKNFHLTQLIIKLPQKLAVDWYIT